MNLDKLDPSFHHFKEQRRHMVQYLRKLGIKDERVLEAMSKVPREYFLDLVQQDLAYKNRPLGIGYGQTISQPYIVAYMSEVAAITPTDKVLEIGTGSGYQAAILGELAHQVHTLEIIPQLVAKARQKLNSLGYQNIHVQHSNGYQGWPEEAPYDAIMVTAAPPQIPTSLVDQLALNGKMVIPVGQLKQKIVIVTKTYSGVTKKTTLPVLFVPMKHKSILE
ncbi:MAG: protein-L-isoaspartate(D-aspartate) O-methyltransferase [Xenococcus sp. MO_188.B8]|nr:protein-L-isoaspartate(D-aspartate) O-methyltransferase [Xenococcus sp. MO_188.B8]